MEEINGKKAFVNGRRRRVEVRGGEWEKSIKTYYVQIQILYDECDQSLGGRKGADLNSIRD